MKRRNWTGSMIEWRKVKAGRRWLTARRKFLQIPLRRLHVAELAKVLTICEKAFEMLNLAPFLLGDC